MCEGNITTESLKLLRYAYPHKCSTKMQQKHSSKPCVSEELQIHLGLDVAYDRLDCPSFQSLKK